MSASILDLLQGAIDAGQRVTIVYLGGSKPGRPRVVAPLRVTGEDLVAVEPGSSTRKMYKIRRIASVQLGEVLSPSDTSAPADPESLAACVEAVRAELSAAGWHLHEDVQSFGVGTLFKNGKPKKTPSVLLQYFDPGFETFIDDDGREVSVPRELTGHERPWRVDSWRFTQGRTFTRLSKAFTCFLEEVRSSDPTAAKSMFAGHGKG